VSQALWFINPQNPKKPDKMHIALEVNRIKGVGEGSRLWLHRQVVDIEGLDIFGKPRTSIRLETESLREPQVSTVSAADVEALEGLLEERRGLSQMAMAEALGGKRHKVRSVLACLGVGT